MLTRPAGGVQSRIHAVHEAAAKEAVTALHQKSFGQVGESLDAKLEVILQRDLVDTLNRNEVQSSRTCGRLEAEVPPHPAACSHSSAMHM